MQPNNSSLGLKHYRRLLRIAIGGPIAIALAVIIIMLLTHKVSVVAPSSTAPVIQNSRQNQPPPPTYSD